MSSLSDSVGRYTFHAFLAGSQPRSRLIPAARTTRQTRSPTCNVSITCSSKPKIIPSLVNARHIFLRTTDTANKTFCSALLRSASCSPVSTSTSLNHTRTTPPHYPNHESKTTTESRNSSHRPSTATTCPHPRPFPSNPTGTSPLQSTQSRRPQARTTPRPATRRRLVRHTPTRSSRGSHRPTTRRTSRMRRPRSCTGRRLGACR